MSSSNRQYAVIMAGGSGTRMKSVLPKPLINVGNKPMIMHLIDNILNVDSLKQTEIVLIVSEKTKPFFIDTLQQNKRMNYVDEKSFSYRDTIINICVQPVANGTGGALVSTSEFFADKDKNSKVLVLSGDVPLITKNTMRSMFDKIDDDTTQCVILAKDTPDNFGYGRIVTNLTSDSTVNFVKIVEQKDCNDNEKLVTLINTGTYAFKVGPLMDSLKHLNCNNAQNEYYLTDCPRIIKETASSQEDNANPVKVHVIQNSTVFDETLGANTPEQLEQLRREYLKKFVVEEIGSTEQNLSDKNVRNLMRVLDQLSSKKSSTPIEELNVDKIRQHILSASKSTMNTKKTFIIRYEDDVIGTASALIEDKLIHDLGKVSHIEDVVVDEEYRGLGLAKLLMLKLIEFSKDQNCYKIILDASNDVKGFYENLGFKIHSNNMRLDI